jgi:hypothetical protein
MSDLLAALAAAEAQSGSGSESRQVKNARMAFWGSIKAAKKRDNSKVTIDARIAALETAIDVLRQPIAKEIAKDIDPKAVREGMEDWLKKCRALAYAPKVDEIFMDTVVENWPSRGAIAIDGTRTGKACMFSYQMIALARIAQNFDHLSEHRDTSADDATSDAEEVPESDD